ncbi:MAG: nucleotidyltransferase domain-containing protein [Phycisphaerae bacterium]|nr:nucleotidyltransferase domain-containing protein [Phycisphaerae bacterium]
MVKLIDDKQNELKTLCGRFNVKTLEVFGSAAQDTDLAETSDLDFLVRFLPMTPPEHADAYFGLLNALKELFDRSVDLLEVKAIDNPYLLESINHNRVELYAA